MGDVDDVSEQGVAQRRIRAVADQTFGWSHLRPAQVTAMEQLLLGRDVLAVLPTGAGKSAIYQVVAVLVDGPTVVVSPLIALQRDQVVGLADTEAPDAVTVNSDQARGTSDKAMDAIQGGAAEFVFLSPEQLTKDEVIAELQASKPSLFVVDEAHCVSTWGHDFRPDYLRLGEAIRRVGRPRVLALTGAAAAPVREDIVSRLDMRDPAQVVSGFDRPNLRLEVRRFTTDEDKRRAASRRLQQTATPGLLYVATRKDAEGYAAELTDGGVRAAAYHAGLKSAQRKSVHDRFLDDDVDVVAATSAFGMGIDKPNVRFVFHATIPESLDAYYQEIGRAGRDGEPAEAVLFYRPEDLGLRRFFAGKPVDSESIGAVVRALHKSDQPTSRRDLARRAQLPVARVTRIVDLLEQAGALRVLGRGRLGPVADLPPSAAVERAVEVAEARHRLERSRIEMMRGYAETTGCRRQFLLGYFGELMDEPCGNCDMCAAGTAESWDADAEAESPYSLNTRVVHDEWGPGTVMQHEGDRITVLFEQVGYKTLVTEVVERADLLRDAQQ